MSIITTEITLENPADVSKARDGFIPESEIRRVTVEAIVDTGAWSLVLSETVRRQLGLETAYRDTVEVANNRDEFCDVTEPVTVHWKNRRTSCEAVVLPEQKDVLLGALPLEGMDLTINPKRELVGAHGDKVFMPVM